MILLEEFLSAIYTGPQDLYSPVYVYDGEGVPEETELLCVFESSYIPSVTLNENTLKKRVERIYWMQKGIAVCVVDSEK